MIASSFAVYVYLSLVTSAESELQFQSDPVLSVLFLIFHPLIHVSPLHLWGNAIAFLVVGFLIESWMTFPTRRTNHLILLWCYLVSVAIDSVVFAYIKLGVSPCDLGAGLSGMISAGIPFTLYGYWKKLVPLKLTDNLSRLVPLGVGMGLGWFVNDFVAVMVTGASQGIFPCSNLFHLAATVISAMSIGIVYVAMIDMKHGNGALSFGA